MRDYKKVRKALDNLTGQMSHLTAYFGHPSLAAFNEAKIVLADTTEASEMERLIPWLEEHIEEEGDRWKTARSSLRAFHEGKQDAYKIVKKHIKSEFGYEGEDANL